MSNIGHALYLPHHGVYHLTKSDKLKTLCYEKYFRLFFFLHRQYINKKHTPL